MSKVPELKKDDGSSRKWSHSSILHYNRNPPWAPEKVNTWQVRYKNGYVVDRRIVIGYMLLVILIGLYVWHDEFGWNLTTERVWQHCPADSPMPCRNPVYLQCGEWYCMQEYWMPGYEYGRPPGWWYENYAFIALMLGVLAVLVNHFVLNKNFQFSEDGL